MTVPCVRKKDLYLNLNTFIIFPTRLISSLSISGLVIPDVSILLCEKYRAFLMYEGQLFTQGCSHWYMNWDIFSVVLSQLDTFVDVQRLTKII